MSHEMSHIIDANRQMYKVCALLDLLYLLGIASAEPPSEPLVMGYLDRQRNPGW